MFSAFTWNIILVKQQNTFYKQVIKNQLPESNYKMFSAISIHKSDLKTAQKMLTRVCFHLSSIMQVSHRRQKESTLCNQISAFHYSTLIF